MARRAIVIEDSDDELPELATLFKAKELKTLRDVPKKTEAAAAPKPRRRVVLNGVSDNPLLRPLGREVGREKERKGRGKTASSALVAVCAPGGGGVGLGVVESVRGEVVKGKKGGMVRAEKAGETEPAAAREGGAVDEVVEGLVGLRMDEEEDIMEPRVRKARGDPVAALRDGAEDEEDSNIAVLLNEMEEEEDDSPVVDTRKRRVRIGRPVAAVRAETPEEEEEEEKEDSIVEDEEDDMSDFIVSDHSSVEEEEEEEELSPVPAPKSVRKLVRGRRPDTSSKPEAPKAKEIQALHLDWSDDDTEESVVPRPVTRRLFPTEKDQATKDFEEECPILTYDPPTSKAIRKPAKKTILTTPPPSPKKTLTSPQKLPRIPTATHSPSTDDFWKASVINDWNDEFSPQKPLRALNLDPSPTGSPKKPAAPAKKDKALLERKKQFNASKHALALSFLRELDDHITDGRVSALAASTGGVTIVWSKKLNTTAGRANWKREAIRSRPAAGSSLPPTTTYRHHASIELAEKVIDDEDRLLNVVAHEFCHLANFMVSGVTTNPHGKEFKAWAARCSARFGGRGIEVTTKHSYEIAFKYVWRCEAGGCGLEFKRHSRSIDPKRHSCGACKGRLVQVRPVPRGGEEGGEKVVGEYQKYVRDNIGRVRRENVGSPQKYVMALVGRGYRELKAERLRALESGLAVESVVEGKVEDPVGEIVKKIDFLDLTTP
ncbi:hypothetical protein VE03_01271 [Pseudogymnoascus sp. 23342-1-I1]|nr:hypothetical protein VE03_01271 [Pseudogymnoascus sp. 23342-1-I1]